MNNTQTSCLETIFGRITVKFHNNESGQITILYMFGLLAFVLLFAFIFNTAKQTTTKMQMQGAADAAAISAGVWTARGMNLIALNNNAMADVLSLMITVRALLQTSKAMYLIVIPGMIKAATGTVVGAVIIPELVREAIAYAALERILYVFDNVLSNSNTGIGWKIMRALDKINQFIKAGFSTPPITIAMLQAFRFAQANGANFGPRALLIPGQKDDIIPLLPLVRGPQKAIVERSEDCRISPFVTAAELILFFTGPISSLPAIGTFNIFLELNYASLKEDNSFVELLGDVIGVFTYPPLKWPSDPPKPMLLTDAPERDALATSDKEESDVNLRETRNYLQLLAISFAEMKASPIADERFKNPGRLWLTYAQTDIYNPSNWSMFSQDWRAKLSRSTVLNRRSNEVLSKIGLGGSISDLSFVATH